MGGVPSALLGMMVGGRSDIYLPPWPISTKRPVADATGRKDLTNADYATAILVARIRFVSSWSISPVVSSNTTP
jgi:hypothetical protein